MSHTLPIITDNKIWESNRILKWIVDQIGFRTWREKISLLMIIAIPFVFSSIATLQEKRFNLGHVTDQKEVARVTKPQYEDFKKTFKLIPLKPRKNKIDGVDYIVISMDHLEELASNKEDIESMSNYLKSLNTVQTINVKGMSFIGDTMVWPCYILVPITLLLLARAIRKIELFFDSIRCSIVDCPDAATKYEAIIEKSSQSFSAINYWKWAIYAGLIVGVFFVAWNMVTCTFPEKIHPYKSEAIYSTLAILVCP